MKYDKMMCIFKESCVTLHYILPLCSIIVNFKLEITLWWFWSSIMVCLCLL